jgi:two-component system cell cycle sensor histidine kinase/response regulator CckA
MDPTKKLHTSDEPERNPTQDGPGHRHEHRTLLVADDEAHARDPIVALLERSGFKILTASDCHEAVSVFRDHADSIVAVLLDYSMPGGRSDDVFEELQRIRPNVPVVMMSGYAEEDVTGSFKGMGIVGFLQKPFFRADLLNTIQEAIDSSAA